MRGKLNQFDRRAERVRRTLAKSGSGRPRLCVFRSSKHIYAQVIDDTKGHTLASASSLEKDLKSSLKTGADKAAATAVGTPASTRWCSIAAATAITAASRHWPTAPAKAA